MTTTGENITQLMAPISDDVAVSDGNRGAIGLVPLLTLKTSCFGSLIEGQTVLFSATAFRWGTPTPIAAGSWSFTCTPPDTVTQPYGNEGPIYALTIADGCTSIALQCSITTALGCQFTVMQDFPVVTQPQAQEEEPLCALARRIKGEHWYDPLWWIEKYLPEFNLHRTHCHRTRRVAARHCETSRRGGRQHITAIGRDDRCFRG